MNERLKQLAQQAGFCGSNLSNTQIGTSYETALENFAELVIEEYKSGDRDIYRDIVERLGA